MMRKSSTIGERIAAARTRLRYSASEAARLIGVNRKTLAHWEADRREPRISNLKRMSLAYRASLMDLIGDA